MKSATERNPDKFSVQASLKSATVRNLGPRSEWVIEAPRRSLKKKKKVGENNGQLRFVRHHGWRTQARLDQKVGENNAQLRLVRHHGWRRKHAGPIQHTLVT